MQLVYFQHHYIRGESQIRTRYVVIATITHVIINFNFRVRKKAKIRIRYNQAPHLTQDTNGKVTTSQLDITNENQEVSPFPAGDQKALIN